jgi:hypothetical protein
MSSSVDGNEILLTDSQLIKAETIKHFKTIAGVPPSTTPNINDFPQIWKDAYQPLDIISSAQYHNLLSPVTTEELNSTINSLPNNKAAGLSGIPYEMIKNLPDIAKSYLKDLISLCFASSFIPSEWKDATIYPIPKPHEWNCYLKNTRPIMSTPS